MKLNKNLAKFNSFEELTKYRGQDGWDYPSINLVSSPFESSIYGNNEFVMRWYPADSAKVPYFSGDVTYTDFKAWVDSCSSPCEIKKDKTEFNYLLRSDFTKTATTFNGTTESGSSHYNTDDKADYFQMAEIKNINVGLFEDVEGKWKEVRFNFDNGCPKGFHKWFAHPYWNESLGAYTKLFGRYDSTCSGSAISSVGTDGVDVIYGGTQPSSVGNWSANLALTGIKKVNALAMTYWEHLVMRYIFCAYYKTFHSQGVFTGIQSGSETAARAFTNGATDTLGTEHQGKVSVSGGEAYRFLFLENPLHGKQWIWTPGWVGQMSQNKYYMTFDDIVANKTATMAISDADISGSSVQNMSASYIKNIDLFGVPTEIGASATSGFYDGAWSNTYDSRVAYVGGIALLGSVDGVVASAWNADASYQAWDRRSRLTLNR